jgi:hypothetical protein
VTPQKQTSGDWLGTPEAVALPFDGFNFAVGDRAPDGNVDGSRVVTGYDRNTVPINLSASTVVSDATITHSHTATIDNFGESGLDKNLPPYYALCYIIKIPDAVAAAAAAP